MNTRSGVGAGQPVPCWRSICAKATRLVYESRPDLRRVDIDAGRSINLSLATRGIVPLIDVGVIDIDAITIPMWGRMIHVVDDRPRPPYGSEPHEVIHSVSRSDLARSCSTLPRRRAGSRSSSSAAGSVDSTPPCSVSRTDGPNPSAWSSVPTARIKCPLATRAGRTFETEARPHYKELTLPPGPDGGS